MTALLHPLFLVGCFVLELSIVSPYPLVSAEGALVLGLVVCICAGGVVFAAPTSETRTRQLIGCVVPWLLAILIVANWKLDRSQENRHATVVLETHFGRSWDYVTVQSWQPGKKEESLLLKNSLLSPHRGGFSFFPGDRVTVTVKPGALGLAWVSSINRSR